MPNLTLNYFDLRGRAELSRLILAYANVQYTDNRIPRDEWFTNPSFKNVSPIGQLPYLMIDNVQLNQSMTIARYLAREYNLIGQSSLQQAQVDAIAETVLDAYNVFIKKIVIPILYKNDEALEEGRKEFLETDLNKHFGSIEKLIQSYGQNGHSVGESVTWADLAILDFQTKLLDFYGATLSLDAFPLVQNVLKTVQAQSNIDHYLQTRPNRPV